jgi:hypothetical protein
MRNYAVAYLMMLVILSACSTFTPTTELSKNGQDERAGNNELMVFIGDKISLNYFPPTDAEKEKERIEDEAFSKRTGVQAARIFLTIRMKARYKVLDMISGKDRSQEIDFVTFDHWGNPAFAKRSPVLIYLGINKTGYYQIRGVYAFVYPSKEGRWVYCNTENAYFRKEIPAEFIKNNLRPIELKWDEEVSIEIDGEIKPKFPEAYFKRDQTSLVCLQAAYVDEIIPFQKAYIEKTRS